MMEDEPRRRFRLPWLRVAALAAVAAIALAMAIALRFGIVEPATIAARCDGGGLSPLCILRRVVIGIFGWNGFGLAALGLAVLVLLRPSTLLIALTLVAGIFGLVLYNTTIAALAVSLLPLALARPHPAPDFGPE